MTAKKYDHEGVALDDVVARFSSAMRAKLEDKREDKSGWDDPNWEQSDMIAQLRAHINKGDMVDVANFAMFAWAWNQENHER